jgi:hypothetical protein
LRKILPVQCVLICKKPAIVRKKLIEEGIMKEGIEAAEKAEARRQEGEIIKRTGDMEKLGELGEVLDKLDDVETAVGTFEFLIETLSDFWNNEELDGKDVDTRFDGWMQTARLALGHAKDEVRFTMEAVYDLCLLKPAVEAAQTATDKAEMPAGTLTPEEEREMARMDELIRLDEEYQKAHGETREETVIREMTGVAKEIGLKVSGLRVIAESIRENIWPRLGGGDKKMLSDLMILLDGSADAIEKFAKEIERGPRKLAA